MNKNSTIRDAEVAIDIGVHADLHLEGSVFLNNHIGVKAVSSEGGSPNVLKFEGNLFYSDFNSLPPYEAQMMYAGVYLERIYGFSIGSVSGTAANTFATIENGIVAKTSSFAVHQAGIFPYLINNIPSETLNEDYGNGILMYNSRGIVSQNQFDDNIAAIHAIHSSVEIMDNQIAEATGYGVVVKGTQNGWVTVKNNSIGCFQTGVYLLNLDNTLVNIENNTMTTEEENEFPDVDGQAAIAVEGCTFYDFGGGFNRRALITGNSLGIWQCPKMGGPAVYKARSLYKMVREVMISDNATCTPPDALILPKNDATGSVSKTNGTMLFPNPANETVTLSIAENAVVDRIRIVNLNGQTVQLQNLPEHSKYFSLSLITIPNGIYFVELLNGGKTTQTEKLIIHR